MEIIIKKLFGLLSFLILCSFSIDTFANAGRADECTPKGSASRRDFNKYKVTEGLYQNSDIRNIYIITRNCSISGYIHDAYVCTDSRGRDYLLNGRTGETCRIKGTTIERY